MAWNQSRFGDVPQTQTHPLGFHSLGFHFKVLEAGVSWNYSQPLTLYQPLFPQTTTDPNTSSQTGPKPSPNPHKPTEPTITITCMCHSDSCFRVMVCLSTSCACPSCASLCISKNIRSFCVFRVSCGLSLCGSSFHCFFVSVLFCFSFFLSCKTGSENAQGPDPRNKEDSETEGPRIRTQARHPKASCSELPPHCSHARLTAYSTAALTNFGLLRARAWGLRFRFSGCDLWSCLCDTARSDRYRHPVKQAVHGTIWCGIVVGYCVNTQALLKLVRAILGWYLRNIWSSEAFLSTSFHGILATRGRAKQSWSTSLYV